MSLVKKVLVFFSVLVNASVCHPAEWEIYRHKGDDLEGIAPYVSYGYGNQTGSVVLYDNFSTIKFVSGQYSFFKYETKYVGKKSLHYATGMFGVYKDDNLLTKGIVVIDVQDDKSEFGYLKEVSCSDTFSVDLLLFHNYLCRPGYSVRFKIPRYGKTDFDVRVPYHPDFEKFCYIPQNVKKKEEAAKLKAQEDELMKVKQEIAQFEKELKQGITQFSNRLDQAENKYNLAVKNGYTHSAKKLKKEILEIKKNLGEFLQDSKKRSMEFKKKLVPFTESVLSN